MVIDKEKIIELNKKVNEFMAKIDNSTINESEFEAFKESMEKLEIKDVDETAIVGYFKLQILFQTLKNKFKIYKNSEKIDLLEDLLRKINTIDVNRKDMNSVEKMKVSNLKRIINSNLLDLKNGETISDKIISDIYNVYFSLARFVDYSSVKSKENVDKEKTKYIDKLKLEKEKLKKIDIEFFEKEKNRLSSICDDLIEEFNNISTIEDIEKLENEFDEIIENIQNLLLAYEKMNKENEKKLNEELEKKKKNLKQELENMIKYAEKVQREFETEKNNVITECEKFLDLINDINSMSEFDALNNNVESLKYNVYDDLVKKNEAKLKEKKEKLEKDKIDLHTRISKMKAYIENIEINEYIDITESGKKSAIDYCDYLLDSITDIYSYEKYGNLLDRVHKFEMSTFEKFKSANNKAKKDELEKLKKDLKSKVEKMLDEVKEIKTSTFQYEKQSIIDGCNKILTELDNIKDKSEYEREKNKFESVKNIKLVDLKQKIADKEKEDARIEKLNKTTEKHREEYVNKLQKLLKDVENVENYFEAVARLTIEFYIADCESELYRTSLSIDENNLSEPKNSKDLTHLHDLLYEREKLEDLLSNISSIKESVPTKSLTFLLKTRLKDELDDSFILKKKQELINSIAKDVGKHINKSIRDNTPKTAKKYSQEKREEFIKIFRDKGLKLAGLTHTDILDNITDANFKFGEEEDKKKK